VVAAQYQLSPLSASLSNFRFVCSIQIHIDGTFKKLNFVRWYTSEKFENPWYNMKRPVEESMHSCFCDNMSARNDFAGTMQDRKHIFHLLLYSIKILEWGLQDNTILLCYEIGVLMLRVEKQIKGLRQFCDVTTLLQPGTVKCQMDVTRCYTIQTDTKWLSCMCAFKCAQLVVSDVS
jgi:hypothetical protein